MDIGRVRPNRHWTDEELLSRYWLECESELESGVSWRDAGLAGALVLVGMALTVLVLAL